MNISDAAREAAKHWHENRHLVEEAVQHGINTATSALTLERDQLRQQLAEAREDSRTLDWLEENWGEFLNFLDFCENPKAVGLKGLRAAIKTLNPPTDEK